MRPEDPGGTGPTPQPRRRQVLHGQAATVRTQTQRPDLRRLQAVVPGAGSGSDGNRRHRRGGTALVILAEIGVDVSRFATEKHFASWLGVCPRQHESNRTQQKRGPRKGKNRVAIALRMAAQTLGRTMSPLGMFYRRIKSRIGGKGAI